MIGASHILVRMHRTVFFCMLPCLVGLAACVRPAPNPVEAIAPRSGIEFASADVRSLQADDFANPGMLWVARG